MHTLTTLQVMLKWKLEIGTEAPSYCVHRLMLFEASGCALCIELFSIGVQQNRGLHGPSAMTDGTTVHVVVPWQY